MYTKVALSLLLAFSACNQAQPLDLAKPIYIVSEDDPNTPFQSDDDGRWMENLNKVVRTLGGKMSAPAPRIARRTELPPSDPCFVACKPTSITAYDKKTVDALLYPYLDSEKHGELTPEDVRQLCESGAVVNGVCLPAN